MDNQISQQQAEKLANMFQALSNSTRVRILLFLIEGEVPFGVLVKEIGPSKSAISHQLKGLHDQRLIRLRRQGRNVFVSLDDTHIADLFQRGLEHIKHQ